MSRSAADAGAASATATTDDPGGVDAGRRRRRRASVASAAALFVAGSVAVAAASRANGRLVDFTIGPESMTLLHAASSHFPIGLLLSSAAFDLAGALTRRDDLRAAAFWTQILGALSAVVTVVIGYLGNPFATDTSEIAAKVLVHQRVGVVTAALFGLLALWRVARGGRLGRVEQVAYALATLLGVAAVSATGYLGGHLME